ncbi:MAG: hypothetical protein ACI9A2_004562 [Halioglobus sp.]|jgi:hypothetical protein
MSESPDTPLIECIKVNTVAAPDITQVEKWYTEWLGYSVCERGEISELLASSWGAPAMAGRSQILMRPESGADVFIRVCHIDPIEDYKPMNSVGWNAFELIVDDVYALHEKLQASPFKIIGPPASLGGDLDFIHAMQVEGPAGDVLYLTCDRVRAADTLLPPAGAFVGRSFIVVLADHGVDRIQSWYSEKFLMQRDEDMRTEIGVVAQAQGLPANHMFDMGFMALAETGNFIEFDGYESTIPRRLCSDGQLPPGCSIASFVVQSIDAVDLEYFSDPVSDSSLAYGGGRSRTALGPAGELIELIEGG